MKAAFIMRSKNPNNDYNGGKFSVAPDDFGEKETKKLLVLVHEKTPYLDAVPSGCIVVQPYCDEKFAVLGICAFISKLAEKCGREIKYSLDGKKNENSTLKPRRSPVFLGFVFKRKEVQEAFDITYELLAKYYEQYMSELWEKPLTFGGMETIASKYEEIAFSKVSDASKAAVSLSPEILNETVTTSRPVKLSEHKESHEPEYIAGENKHVFLKLSAILIIGISIVAVIVGLKLMKNFMHETPAQQVIILPQDAEKN